MVMGIKKKIADAAMCEVRKKHFRHYSAVVIRNSTYNPFDKTSMRMQMQKKSFYEKHLQLKSTFYKNIITRHRPLYRMRGFELSFPRRPSANGKLNRHHRIASKFCVGFFTMFSFTLKLYSCQILNIILHIHLEKLKVKATV